MEEYADLELERTWPLFGLSIAHRELLLREATDDDVLALARVVEGGVVEAGNEHFMPRLLLGRAATIEERAANFLRYHWADGRPPCPKSGTSHSQWSSMARWSAVKPFIPRSSLLCARSTLARTWLGMSRAPVWAPHESNGPRAVVRLFWGGVGHQWVCGGNEPSRRLSARLGYEADGIEPLCWPGAGEAIKSYRLRLTRKRWLENRPQWLDEVNWTGVSRAKAFLGI